MFISGFHLKLNNVEHGKYLILAKLLGSKSKVLLDEDVTKWKDPHGHSVKFSDPLLLEVPSSSTILLLQVKHVSRTKGLLRSGLTKMKTLGYVYVKVKDTLQEDNHRIHDFFSVQKGIPATLFCSVSLMSPYMNYITLLQLGSQNEKHEFGDDTNHFRKIQNEDAEEGQSLSLSLSLSFSLALSLSLLLGLTFFFSLCVFLIFAACSVFTFGRMKYSKKEGVLQRSGISERNIRDTKACLESMKFEWYDQNKVIDVILIKMNNRNKEIKEIVALIFRYEADDGKTWLQTCYRKFDLDNLSAEGKPAMEWAKLARIELIRPGKLRNTLKKCRLESNAEFNFINESDIEMDLEMKTPDVWAKKDPDEVPHIVGSWILSQKASARRDSVNRGMEIDKRFDDRSEKLKKTLQRKNTTIARAEVYVHYMQARKGILGCYSQGDSVDKYVYRGFKLMIQKSYVSYVPAIIALVITLKEIELRDCV